MKTPLCCWAAAALSFAIAASAAFAAFAAPSAPRVVATATQASGSSPSVTVTTTAPIIGGDVIVVIASGELNMRPWVVGNCTFCVSAAGQPGWPPELIGLDGAVGQASARTYVAWAAQDVAAGAQIRVDFGGAAGAKAVTVLAISGAENFRVLATGGSLQAQGTGTAIGWSCNASCSIAPNLMMLSASIVLILPRFGGHPC